MSTSTLLFFVNGVKTLVTDVQPEVTLLEFLREKGLTGTKLGCGEGGCGACTVMVSSFDPVANKVLHRAVNACLAPLCSVDWCAVTTVEGIGSVKTGLHPVQERIARLHGSQCGFCTPGIVMALYAFLRNHPRPTAHDLEEAIDGNICRCTGYRPILDAAKSFAVCDADGGTGDKPPAGCCGGSSLPGGCCKVSGAFLDSEVRKTGAVDALGRTLFRVVSTTADKAARAPCDTAWNPESEPIFPPFLKTHPVPEELGIVGKSVSWYRPTSLPRLLELRAQHPTAKLIGGNSEIGIEVKFKDCKYPALISVGHVPELRQVTVVRPGVLGIDEFAAAFGVTVGEGAHDVIELSPAVDPMATPSRAALLGRCADAGGVLLGGAVTLTALRDTMWGVVQDPTLPVQCSRTALAVHTMLRWFASSQIRNVATLSGNIATASPISDMNPLCVATAAVLCVASPSAGTRRLISASRLFKAYRKTELAPDDVIVSIFIPFCRANEYVFAYKQARRREDDITIVAAAFRVFLVPDSAGGVWRVADAGAAFAGMSPITAQSPSLVRALVRSAWNEDTMQAACAGLKADLTLPLTVPGGMAAFRESVAASMFFKFYVAATLELQRDIAAAAAAAAEDALPPAPTVAADVRSTAEVDPRPVSCGTQLFDLPLPAAVAAGLLPATPSGEATTDAPVDIVPNMPPCDISTTGPDAGGSVGKAVMHMSGLYQVTGEALYCDDIPVPPGCLEAALVLSNRPHARITAINTAPALALEGVVDVVLAKDVPGENHFGVVMHDEEILATDMVYHVGQVIAVVIASTRRAAQAGAKAVAITYEDVSPAVFTIDDAIATGSLFDYNRSIISGDVDAAFAGDGVQVLEGATRSGGQEHFYLECNACVCIPGEGNESISVVSSTQALMKTQVTLASCLGLPQHKVVVRTKRVGGGFGGKESRTVPIAAAVSVAAMKHHRPVRINVDRDVDMLITGQRHAFQSTYKVGFRSDGTIVGLDLALFCNAGWSSDLSFAVMDRALFSCTNAYNVGALRANGRVCRTNIASHTAFRGFGSPQGMFVMEQVVSRVAQATGLSPEDVRRRNFIKDGDRMPYGQLVHNVNLERMWDEAHGLSGFAARRVAVEAFNAANRYRKRGIAMVPVCYGINFGQTFLNQAGALVLIYTDGTVLVTHGGVEIGQGLYTKMAQIAAQSLGIPTEMVHVEETATDKVPNSSPTAASASTDLYGGAVADACATLAQRLAPFLSATPKPSWQEAVKQAYFARVNLSAQGFRCQEHTGYDWAMVTDDNSKRGKGPFEYHTGGVACAEVEVDTLTGDHTVVRVDIVMDIGNSVNPVIDVGQVEGAFTQGMGWSTIEELVWGDSAHPWVRPGQLFTRGPGTYNPPTFNDTPVDFRVSLLHNAPNPRAVYSSKAIGEPPLFLGCTVAFALTDAVNSARRDAGVASVVLDIPATAERIRMSCPDAFVERVVGGKDAAEAAYRVNGSY